MVIKINSKRNLAFGISFILLVYLSFDSCISKIGGNFERNINDVQLSSGAQALIDSAMMGIPDGELRDYHTHIAGTGVGNSGCFVNPKMVSKWHPLDYLKFKIYTNSAGINDIDSADNQYIKRLVTLARSFPKHPKFVLLAFDKNYDKSGNVNSEKTEFYVPNEKVYELSKTYPDLFIPCISVHPYRKDALMELDKWGALGVKQLKWLPNAMGIDPSDSRCDSFYIKMKQYEMTLLSHVGEEKAIKAEEDQKFGNPLLLRKPLAMGVKVIMAHCASLGSNADLDSKEQKQVDNFSLFFRMMSDEKYKGLLYGDISAMCQYNRVGLPLETVLKGKNLQNRLINGSDYPLPAINALVRTKTLVKEGYITSTQRQYLNEIYKYNPLLFDFVLKRALRADGNAENKFSTDVFLKNKYLGY